MAAARINVKRVPLTIEFTTAIAMGAGQNIKAHVGNEKRATAESNQQVRRRGILRMSLIDSRIRNRSSLALCRALEERRLRDAQIPN